MGVPVAENSSRIYKLYSFTILSLFVYFMCFGQLYHVWDGIQNSDGLYQLCRAIAIFLIVCPVVIKLPLFLARKGEIFAMENELLDISRSLNSDNKTKLWNARIFRHYCLYFSLPYLTVLSTMVVSAVSFRERKLGHNIWIPFDYKKSDMNFILAVIISSAFGAHEFLVACNIDFILISYIGILKGISSDFLEKLNEENIEDSFNLRNVIEFLVSMRKMNKKLNKLFSSIYLPQLLFISITLSIAVYCLIVVRKTSIIILSSI